jgi:protein-tyrosine phosphatase
MYFSGAMDMLENGDILTMCDSDYVLVEFLPGDNFSHIAGGIEELRYMGYLPILAHVERYECMIRDIDNVKELARRDVLMQVNAASIAGALGSKIRKSVIKMIDNGYIDYVGTDAHDTGKRAPRVAKCISILSKYYEREDVDELMCTNALDIIEDNQ